MGIYDRDYTQQNFQSHFRNAPQMRMTFPSLTPMVKRLLIINFAVFFAQVIGADEFLTNWFAVYPASFIKSLEIWRLVGYQFLHGGIGHIFFNMLGVFFLGPTLEQHWGSRRFLFFYLGCGIAGGLFYTFLVTVGFLEPGFLVGASGSILGMLAACAILFPHFVVFILFFPVPIRVAAIAGTLLYILLIISKSNNAGGEAAHLGGMAAGAAYVFSRPFRAKLKLKMQGRKWDKNLSKQKEVQLELDRILEKVHTQGLQSLTRKEKNILKQATQQQNMKNRQTHNNF